MENKDGTYPQDVGSIEPIPIYEQTPVLDMLPSGLKDALQGIGGLLDDPMIALPGGFAKMPLKQLLKELAERKVIFKQQAAKFKRAKDVEQSALRDGYLPDIEGSQKIMRNTDSYGKVLKKEMDELQKLIDNYDKSSASTIMPVTKKNIKPLTETEFYKKYDMHHDLRGASSTYPKSDTNKLKNKILDEGIKTGWVNSAYKGLKGKPDYYDKKFGTKKGQTTYLVPKANVDKQGIKIIKPYKISQEEVLDFDYDFQPAYEAYLKNINKLNKGNR